MFPRLEKGLQNEPARAVIHALLRFCLLMGKPEVEHGLEHLKRFTVMV